MLWQVKSDDQYIRFGDVTRRLREPSACNQRFKNAYWCPRKKWFNREPCPFSCRNECDNFRRMCGN